MNDIEKKGKIVLESWREEMTKQARKHRDESVFVSHLGPEADVDVMIGNLRFMSFCAGYKSARLAERRELLEFVQEIERRVNAIRKGKPGQQLTTIVINQIKQKLEEK